MLRNLFAVVLIVSAPVLQAQVRVVESLPQGFGPEVAQTTTPTSTDSDVYAQIRALQEEISSLRGLVEEQDYQLKQLKQLQLDNYIDLDRRLSGGAQSRPSIASAESPASLPAQVAVDDNLSEADVYRNAYDLLNQKDFSAAENAFKDHLTRFPSGDFASNSYYWLGKIAMLKKDYPQAKTWFTDLIANFPATAKVPDAQLDLGKVHFLMGDKLKAKTLLSQVAAGNTDAARLAAKFLSDNF